MTTLADLSRVVRSKNAGPCLVTFDLMFDSPAAFDRAAAGLPAIRVEVARRYRLAEGDVAAMTFAPALAIKLTIPRATRSGDPGDSDVYGAQQHGPLLSIPVPEARDAPAPEAPDTHAPEAPGAHGPEASGVHVPEAPRPHAPEAP